MMSSVQNALFVGGVVALLAGGLLIAPSLSRPTQYAVSASIPSVAIDKSVDWKRDAVNFAQRRILAGLRDPESADLSNVTAHTTDKPNIDVVCGSVNAKNGFGGYAGSTQFVVIVHAQAIDSENVTATTEAGIDGESSTPATLEAEGKYCS